ncbi:MAG: hypothetical protein JNK79_06445 [Chitinophagaceae bacterium]|nr:hypothetical protein [Chitinophagaceae bacterium]
MKRYFPALFAIIAATVFSCTKNTGGGGGGEEEQESTAEFQFQVPEDPCLSGVLHGTFYAGAPMTENEYITINVNVTRPGTIFYSTESVNGFSFAISDTVEETGIQEVKLRGKGMPVEPGNNRFIVAAANSDIAYTIPVIQQAVQLEEVPSGIYMKGTLGGESFNIVFPGDEDDALSEKLNGDSVLVSAFVHPGGAPAPGYGSLTLQKQFLRGMQDATEEVFLAFFNPGSSNIAFDRCGKFSDGILVKWIDDEGKEWSISKDGEQEGSTFKIVGVEDGHRADGKYYVKVKAYLTCNLYRSPGEKKKLDNAEIVSCFVMDRD